jgi:glycosyltransferase involved in cell wall biosynthesis
VRAHPDARRKIERFPGLVYASMGQVGTLVRNRRAPHWILDQHNADVHVWRVRAAEATTLLERVAATLNRWLCEREFPRIYAHVGRIIAVCEEDAVSTRALASGTPITVTANGIDCSYYSPHRPTRAGHPRLLFTGTAVERNMRALRWFVQEIFPAIVREVPDVELMVGGCFDAGVQAEFRRHAQIRFSGALEDIRPVFDTSDVFVAPFVDCYGSKLKIAQAMAMAMAIVSTPAGVRGFPLVDEESVLIASTTARFTSHCVALLRDERRRERMGKLARRAALAAVDWPVLGDGLLDVLHPEHACGSQRMEREGRGG